MKYSAPAALLSLTLAGCTAAGPKPPLAVAPVSAPVAASGNPTVPAGMQYLFGSGEAAAISQQSYNNLIDHVRAMLAEGKSGQLTSAVLATGATLDSPSTMACGSKPPAAVFDVDETILLNIGFESDAAAHPDRPYDEAIWGRWEQTGVDRLLPVPGVPEALKALRAMGVTVIFNTNRSADNASFTQAALEHAGLGPATHGDTLWLKGDLGSGSGKDSRRAAISERYCVIALGGDQLGDFSDLFTGDASTRRAATQGRAIADFWGRRWFVLPNPVYGAALKGSYDEIFPAAKRWDADTKESK